MMPNHYEEALFYEAYPVYLLQNGLGFLLGIVWGVLVAVIGLLLVLRAKEPLVGFRLIGIALLVWGISDAIGYAASWADWGLFWGLQYQLSPLSGGLMRLVIDTGEWTISAVCLGLVGAGLLSLLKALQSV